MNYAFTNGKILNGTKDMQIQTGLCILVRDGKIYDIIRILLILTDIRS